MRSGQVGKMSLIYSVLCVNNIPDSLNECATVIFTKRLNLACGSPFPDCDWTYKLGPEI